MGVDEAWRAHRQWSAVAQKTATELDRSRSLTLGLVLVGALLGALAAQRQWFSGTATIALGAVAAAALAVAGVIQTRLLTAERVKARVGTRAASEALKGLVYQYLAGVPPFAGPDRDSALARKVSEVERLSVDHAPLVVRAVPDESAVPQVDGLAEYVDRRAEEQRNWHERRAGEHLAQARYWRTAELIATGVAAVLAAVGGVVSGPGLSTWVAVATTAAAAFAAHLAGSQHDRIADSYARTAVSLTATLRLLNPHQATQDEAAAFVASVEQILAAQNETWVGLFTSRSGG